MLNSSDNSEQPVGMDDSVSPFSELGVAEFKVNLNACLKSIKSSGTFATFQTLKNAPYPEIYLKDDSTPISLPLSDDDAGRIRMASQAACPSKRERGSGISNVWELPADNFDVRNGEWEQRLRNVVTTACSKLGLYMTHEDRFSTTLFETRSPQISAQLSKLLLCTEGGVLRPTERSERPPDMFATIFILLPSSHSGGEITVTNAGEKKVFDFSQHSESQTSWTVWFVDTKYDVNPILSGRRLVLQYNLTHATDHTVIQDEKAAHDRQNFQLRKLFATWKEKLHREQYPKALGYVFQHRCLNFCGCHSLTGQDLHVVSQLRDTCEGYGLLLYIAQLEIMSAGICADSDDGSEKNDAGYQLFPVELDRYIVLRRIYTLDGIEVDRWLEVDEGLLMQKLELEGLDPDKEYEGLDEAGDLILQTSEGVPVQHVYCKTIALILPRYYRVDFLIEPYIDFQSESYHQRKRMNPKPKNVSSLIKELSKDLSRNQGDVQVLHGLQQICRLVIRRSRDLLNSDGPFLMSGKRKRYASFFSTETRSQVVSTCVDIDNKELFLEAFDLHPKPLPLCTFRKIGVALARFNVDSILSSLTHHLFTSELELREQSNVLEAIWDGLTEEGCKMGSQLGTAYINWIRDTFEEIVSDDCDRTGTTTYGYDLAYCCRKLADIARDDILKRLIPVIKDKIEELEDATPTAMAFLASIVDDGGVAHMPSDLANEIYLDVVPTLAKRFNIEYYSSWVSEEQATHIVDDSSIVFDRSYQLGLSNELHIIVSRLVSESLDEATLDVSSFDTHLLPLLKQLAIRMSEKMVPAQISPIQALFRGLLPVYIQRFVKDEPKPPTDWARPTVWSYCDCSDHKAFNNFLKDPSREVGKFIMSEPRQNHIREAVDKTGFYTDIDRSRKQRCLIVIKNHQNHYLADHEAFQKRKATAATNIKGLGSEKELMALLGDLYEPVTNGSVVDKIQSVDKAQSDHRPLSDEAGSPRHLTKRRRTRKSAIDSNDGNH